MFAPTNSAQIEQNWNSPIGYDSSARYAGAIFSHNLIEDAGSSAPHRWLARHLLWTSKRSICEIQESTGFDAAGRIRLAKRRLEQLRSITEVANTAALVEETANRRF